jgi:DNA-binding transcriptional MocR family regulator
MTAHANLIAPKFAAVTEILQRQLGETGLATWSRPKGGYFISLDTRLPIADRVIALANEAGVSLTPAGATYPGGRDPKNSNIRLAPTRPALDEVTLAMEVVTACIKLASEEYLAEHPS